MSEFRTPPRLLKHKSWSPDMYREDAWLKRKENCRRLRQQRCRSVTDEDLDELRGCIELGFGFGSDSPRLDAKLARTFPALELYCAVNRHYSSGLSRTSSLSTIASTDSDTTSLAGNPPADSILDLGDEPAVVKTRLRQWAQMVACSVRQNSPFL